jgi:hypothetical protein
VSWQTQQAGVPLVKYGVASGQYSQQQYGTYSSYSAADLCGPPANAWGYITPGFINTAVLQGLQPNTTYYYVYGDQVCGGCGGCARHSSHEDTCDDTVAGSLSTCSGDNSWCGGSLHWRIEMPHVQPPAVGGATGCA